MRIARYTTGDEPEYGVVGGEDGNEIVATLVGDPLYAGVELTGEQHKLADVRLLAPVIPRSKVVCIGRNYAAHAIEMGHDGFVTLTATRAKRACIDLQAAAISRHVANA